MEREDKDGKIVLTGVLMRTDERTLSGRVYPKEMMEREIARYKELIEKKQAFVTLGSDPEAAVVQLSKVAGVTNDMDLIDNDIKLQVELLDTPAGKDARALLEHGVDFRPYGVGSVDENGVVSDYCMVGVSIVAKEKEDGTD